jgi:hypothetical protein
LHDSKKTLLLTVISIWQEQPTNECSFLIEKSLSEFQNVCAKELDIDLGIKNRYGTLILSAGKKHYIGYENEALDIVDICI